MKKRKLFFSILLCIIFHSFLYAQEVPVSGDIYGAVINETVFPFFEALKNGDVSLIKQYIAGDMYESKKVLLEQNTEYPQFLRNYYNGVEFYVDATHRSGDYVIVYISIEYPNGDNGSGKLYLWQFNDVKQGIYETGIWKIIDFKYK